MLPSGILTEFGIYIHISSRKREPIVAVVELTLKQHFLTQICNTRLGRITEAEVACAVKFKFGLEGVRTLCEEHPSTQVDETVTLESKLYGTFAIKFGGKPR